eukprot:TRINITY_DN7061_c0_g1_i2.p2 TRINITY_DN7061_c0_g1~~TRINITY_DN7061_c0_g1_i2.p2  ORF type:complete len:393 (-),score=83.59 TRINITY_DN7061_c0_g1_i2:283-1359(-)
MEFELPDFECLSIRLRQGVLEILDQRLLPETSKWLPANTVQDMWQFIVQLSVRGAPLIAVAAAYSVAVFARQGAGRQELHEATAYVRSSRPTAVNLMHCCDAISAALSDAASDGEAGQAVCRLARRVLQRELDMNDAISRAGAALINDGDGILTHCNTGSLATPGKGTALGVIREAVAQGKRVHVYVDETRPLLQGARLTCWELERSGIAYTLLCDNMAASLMRLGRIQRVFVGADRIAANGDFANKIGTYSVAVLARYHSVPFHAVAPVSTVDVSCASGSAIPIEHRSASEVHGASGSFGTVRWAPAAAATYNPAFDVTPVELVTSFVLDSGVYTQDDIRAGRLNELTSFASAINTV